MMRNEIEISKGGTLKPYQERKIVRTCPTHGDFVSIGSYGTCPVWGPRRMEPCGMPGQFKGYTVDSVQGAR